MHVTCLRAFALALLAPLAPAQGTADCTDVSTTIAPAYTASSSSTVFEVPVVVHVIAEDDGVTGDVPDATVISQIEVLNESFRALPGTPGASGFDTRIRFYLATEDPAGLPTTGILRYANSIWTSDTGSFRNTISWDPLRYLNVYVLRRPLGSGVIWYSFNPQRNGVGGPEDGVNVNTTFFGRNATFPYDEGLSCVAGAGVFLGLFTTQFGGCDTGDCYTSGDLICDTAPEATPTLGCPPLGTTSGCGVPRPIRNYLSLAEDRCKDHFTVEQANRMRCTLLNWRPDLARPEVPCRTPAEVVVRNAGNNPLALASTPPVLGGAATFSVTDFSYGNALLWGYSQPASVVLGSGQGLLVQLASAQLFTRPVPGLPMGSVSVAVPDDASICGARAYCQAVLFGGGPQPFQLTNAVDITAGF